MVLSPPLSSAGSRAPFIPLGRGSSLRAQTARRLRARGSRQDIAAVSMLEQLVQVADTQAADEGEPLLLTQPAPAFLLRLAP